ncbi:hypothetical protein Misp02_42670 [Microtetraspora sp. NBRC 16547]|nr:hypothetical protein Misp02_42670 [Microtetraspora sp. NBRC 16547]
MAPVGWAAVKPVEADRGEATPVAAANAYLLTMFSGSDGEPGIRRRLYRDRESEPLAEVRAWRAKVAAVDSEIKVESGHSIRRRIE